MHLYIISIKATAGSGLLLTELRKDLLAAYWVVVVPRQNDSCGTIAGQKYRTSENRLMEPGLALCAGRDVETIKSEDQYSWGL